MRTNFSKQEPLAMIEGEEPFKWLNWFRVMREEQKEFFEKQKVWQRHGNCGIF